MKRMVILADLHVGHNRALTPKSWFNDYTNEFQKWVLEKFIDFRAKYNNPDILILNGDLADGSQVKTLGVDAVSTDLDLQQSMAVELLEPMIGDKTKTYGINGSGYHGGLGQATNMDRRITEALGGEFKGSIWEFELNGEKFQIAHGSGGGIANPDTYIRRELSLAQKNAGKRRVKCPSILIRSHGHLYLTVGDAATTIYMTPCWEYTTPYMEKRTANLTPDIGGLIIEVDDEIKVFPKLYSIPIEIDEEMRQFEEFKFEQEIKNKKKSRDTRIKVLQSKPEEGIKMATKEEKDRIAQKKEGEREIRKIYIPLQGEEVR